MEWLESVCADAWRCYRSQFLKIAAVILVIWLPIDLLLIYLDLNVFGPDQYARTIRVSRYLDLFVATIGDGAIAVIAAAYVLGKQWGFDDAIHLSVKNLGRLIIVRFIADLAIMGGLILLVLPGIYVAVRVALHDQAILIEKMKPRQGLQRSWELTKGRFLPIAVIYLTQIVLTIAMILITYVAAQPTEFVQPWILEILGDLAVRLLDAYAITCFTFVYFHLAGRESVHPELFGPPRQDQSIFADR